MIAEDGNASDSSSESLQKKLAEMSGKTLADYAGERETESSESEEEQQKIPVFQHCTCASNTINKSAS